MKQQTSDTISVKNHPSTVGNSSCIQTYVYRTFECFLVWTNKFLCVSNLVRGVKFFARDVKWEHLMLSIDFCGKQEVVCIDVFGLVEWGHAPLCGCLAVLLIKIQSIV